MMRLIRNLVAWVNRYRIRGDVRVMLESSSRLVFPTTGVSFVRNDDGTWTRRGRPIANLADYLRRLHIPNSARIARGLSLSGWTNGEEQDILEYWFAGTALPNTPSHIGLFTTTPADDGTGGTEVSGGSYAREAYAKNGTNWGSSTGGAPSTIQSLVAVTFTQATASWGTVASWGYFTAVTAGTLLFFAVLDTSKAVDNGDTAEFAIGSLVAQLGDPGDTY